MADNRPWRNQNTSSARESTSIRMTNGAHRESDNMPEWAEENPRSYWEAADAHERANGRLFREVEFALPMELKEGEQIELAREFARG